MLTKSWQFSRAKKSFQRRMSRANKKAQEVAVKLGITVYSYTNEVKFRVSQPTSECSLNEA